MQIASRAPRHVLFACGLLIWPAGAADAGPCRGSKVVQYCDNNMDANLVGCEDAGGDAANCQIIADNLYRETCRPIRVPCDFVGHVARPGLLDPLRRALGAD